MLPSEVSKFVGLCKDFLHAEWADFKVSGEVKANNICVYNVCATKEIPNSTLDSVCSLVKELQRVIGETFDLCVSKSRPFVSQEVMVAADGRISLYPKRKIIAKNEEAQETLMPPINKKKTKMTPEESFMGGVEQVGNYVLDHVKRITEASLKTGNIKALYLSLSSAGFMKTMLITYKNIFKPSKLKTIQVVLGKYDETIELLTEHIFNYQNDLIRSSVLHDIPSHDWENPKRYQEGEQISLCIHMWAFHMQNLRNDLWRYVTPKSADSILASIFTDSLGVLVTRYSQISPSELRLNQYRADITAILFVAASMLPSLMSSPRYFFESRLHETRAFAVHRRADLLVRIASLKATPLDALHEVFCRNFSITKLSKNAEDPTGILKCPEWLTFFNSRLFPPGVTSISELSDDVATYLTLLVASSRPYPDPGLIVRGLMMRKMLGGRRIVQGLESLTIPLEKGSPCQGALCKGQLCSPPLSPHTVYAAIIQIFINCVNSQTLLWNLMTKVIENTVVWDSFDISQIWNIQRPPWHHVLVQLVSTNVSCVVAQVLQAVPPQPPAQPAHPSQLSVRLEHHLSVWTTQLFTGVQSIADTFQPALIHVANMINKKLPSIIKPAGGHVICQIIVSALYSIVNSRSSLDELSTENEITDGQWDMLVAVGERLCLLNEGNYDAYLTQMTKSLINQLDNEQICEDDDLDFYTDETVIESVTQELSDVVQSTVQGQHSFGIIWKFLVRNMEWVGHTLGISSLVEFEDVSYRPLLSFAENPLLYNPLYNYNRIFYSRIVQEELIKFAGDWNRILSADLWMPPGTIREFIGNRYDFAGKSSLNKKQINIMSKLKDKQ